MTDNKAIISRTPHTVTIPASGTESNIIDLQYAALCGIETPAAMTGTKLTLKGSSSATGDLVPVFNPQDTSATSVEINVATGAARFILLDPNLFAGLRRVQFVSNGTEAAARTITAFATPLIF